MSEKKTSATAAHNGIRQNGIDPDPVSVAMAAMTGVALMLQFATTWRQYNPTPHSGRRHHGPERSGIEGLENAITALQHDMRRITRAIDYGSNDADQDFYRAPLRIGQTSMVLGASEHASFATSLTDAYLHLSAVATWTNSIIRNHPVLASEIGKELNEPLTATAERLNAAMESGRPVGEVIEEFSGALEIIARVLDKKLRERSN